MKIQLISEFNTVELEVSMITSLGIPKKMLLLDELEDKTWIIIFSKVLFSNDNFMELDEMVFKTNGKSVDINTVNITLNTKIVPIQSDNIMIHLEEIPNKSFRLLYSNSFDFKNITSIICKIINFISI